MFHLKHLECQVGIGKRNIHDDHRFFSRFFCGLTARRRELEDAQKQFHALASRISAEEQSRDWRGCSRGVLVKFAIKFSGFQFCHWIYKLDIFQTLPSLDAESHGKCWSEKFSQTLARSEVREIEWWVVLPPPLMWRSLVLKPSIIQSFRRSTAEPLVFSFETPFPVQKTHWDIH